MREMLHHHLPDKHKCQEMKFLEVKSDERAMKRKQRVVWFEQLESDHNDPYVPVPALVDFPHTIIYIAGGHDHTLILTGKENSMLALNPPQTKGMCSDLVLPNSLESHLKILIAILKFKRSLFPQKQSGFQQVIITPSLLLVCALFLPFHKTH